MFWFLGNKSLNQKWQATRKSETLFRTFAEWFHLWQSLVQDLNIKFIDEIRMYWASTIYGVRFFVSIKAGYVGLAIVVVVKKYSQKTWYFLKSGRGLKYTTVTDFFTMR